MIQSYVVSEFLYTVKYVLLGNTQWRTYAANSRVII